MPKNRGRPPKHKATSRAELLQIRLNSLEKSGFHDAAQLSGQALSVWVRDRLRRIAIAELREAGRNVPFLDSQPTAKEV